MELSYEKFRDEKEKLQYFFSIKQCDSIFATHFHESLEIVFLKNGRTEATVNGKSHSAFSGDALFINRFDLHSYKSYKGNETHVFILGRKLTEPFFYAGKRRLSGIAERQKSEYGNPVGR